MTSGTWDRHRGHAMGYDVVEVGYNYRLDEPRAALLSARLPGLGGRHRRAPPADPPLPRAARERRRADLPYADEQVATSAPAT